MHITMSFSQGFSAVTVREWLKTKFNSVQPAALRHRAQTWKLPSTASRVYVENFLFEQTPLDWPLENLFVSDRHGKRIE